MSVLREGNTLMLNAQIFRALMQKRPQVVISYEAAKEKLLAALDRRRGAAPYFHHPVLASHPWLVPYILAAREPASVAWGQNGKPYQVGFTCKGTQSLVYPDQDGIAQPIKIPHVLVMGFVNGERFAPMTALESTFPLSKAAANALLGLEPEPGTKTPPSGPTSPVSGLIEANYTPPAHRPTTKDAAKVYKDHQPQQLKLF
ncbi:MAG: hypothetical protein WC612_00385 [Bdellovibrionales bacterium]